MKRVLVVDGGGAKGLIPAAVLDEMEACLDKPLHEVFDLVVGTSIGGILGAILTSGRLDMGTALDLMYGVVPELFDRRPWPLLPKYSRKPFERVWDAEIGEMKMKQCKTRFMVTAVNECDGLTHYFKSWEGKDGELDLKAAVLRTFAAPLYFGGIVDKANKAVWLDGGTGSGNCPILEALYEVFAEGWLADRTHIVSLGCGYSNHGVSFKRAALWWGKNAREVATYADPADGGLARVQAARTALGLVSRMADRLTTLTIQRVDCQIPEKIDKMDGAEHRDQYVALGRQLANRVDYAPLR